VIKLVIQRRYEWGRKTADLDVELTSLRDPATAKSEEILFKLCSTPNIYKGHYQELLKIWRAYNKLDLKAGQFSAVVDRVRRMVRFDDEMIHAMLDNWSEVWKRKLPLTYFDKDRNLKVTDTKALTIAAKSLNDPSLIEEASLVVARFGRK
jgi:hypothetical protein